MAERIFNDGSFHPFIKVDSYDNIFRRELEDFCEFTDDYIRVYGNHSYVRMIRGDEFSNPLVQKSSSGVTVGFPVTKYEFATRKGEMNNVANQVLPRYIHKDLYNVFFNPCNNLNYEDALVDYRGIPIYAFLNGDGRPIPVAPDGTIFDPLNHSHFMHTTDKKFNPHNIRMLLSNVVEHTIIGELRLYLNHNEADQMVIDTCDGPTTRKYTEPTYFGPIGYFDSAEVYVSPIVPVKKGLCVDIGQPGAKPLCCRRLPSWPNVIYDDNKNRYVDYWGLGVWNRHMAAAIDFENDVYSFDRNAL